MSAWHPHVLSLAVPPWSAIPKTTTNPNHLAIDQAVGWGRGRGHLWRKRPHSANRSGRKRANFPEKTKKPLFPRATKYPLGDSNPCCRTENPESWATRRRGRLCERYYAGFEVFCQLPWPWVSFGSWGPVPHAPGCLTDPQGEPYFDQTRPLDRRKDLPTPVLCVSPYGLLVQFMCVSPHGFRG